MKTVQCENVCKSFITRGSHNRVLNNISFSLETGEMQGILGLNGAGKTTLVRILAGVLAPDSGEVLLFGSRYKNAEKYIKSNLGVVLGGDRSMYYKLTCCENLRFFASLYGLKKNEAEDRIQFYLSKVGLKEKKDALVETLSKGMKQRLLIAKALIVKPRLLILDEPTSGLDIAGQFEIRSIIKELNITEGVSVLLFTHSLAEANELCHKIHILHKGNLLDSNLLEKCADNENISEKITIVSSERLPISSEIGVGPLVLREEIKHEDGFQYIVYGNDDMLKSCCYFQTHDSRIISVKREKLELEDYLYLQYKELG